MHTRSIFFSGEAVKLYVSGEAHDEKAFFLCCPSVMYIVLRCLKIRNHIHPLEFSNMSKSLPDLEICAKINRNAYISILDLMTQEVREGGRSWCYFWQDMLVRVYSTCILLCDVSRRRETLISPIIQLFRAGGHVRADGGRGWPRHRPKPCWDSRFLVRERTQVAGGSYSELLANLYLSCISHLG